MSKRQFDLQGLAGRLVLIASIVLAAFAHTSTSFTLALPAGIDARAYAAQYVLPDGTLPIPCDKSGSGGTHHSGAIPCEFCSLVENAALANPAEVISRTALDASLDNCLKRRIVYLIQRQLGLHGASRAPPVA